MLRWMQANGRPVEARLAAADLGYLPLHEPDRPIPLLNAIAFVREAGRLEGPDIGCRVVSATSILELAMLGRVALGMRTPREALLRVAAALPHHCTHEHIAVTAAAGGALVREVWSLPIDPATLHVIQGYVAALIRALCGMAEARDPLLARVEMVPHPEAGLDHLRRWLGPGLRPAASRTLSVLVADAVADRPFRVTSRDRAAAAEAPDWPMLRGDGTLAGSARAVVAAMLDSGTPSVERLAEAAGMSVRTLQRRLADEGSSFSRLLEGVRRDAALEGLAGGGSLGELAATLGYARQSALTRSVRRWTGRAPSLLRGRGAAGGG
jgi:AraC-like DNA-binding protein